AGGFSEVVFDTPIGFRYLQTSTRNADNRFFRAAPRCPHTQSKAPSPTRPPDQPTTTGKRRSTADPAKERRKDKRRCRSAANRLAAPNFPVPTRLDALPAFFVLIRTQAPEQNATGRYLDQRIQPEADQRDAAGHGT